MQSIDRLSLGSAPRPTKPGAGGSNPSGRTTHERQTEKSQIPRENGGGGFWSRPSAGARLLEEHARDCRLCAAVAIAGQPLASLCVDGRGIAEAAIKARARRPVSAGGSVAAGASS